MEVFEPILFKSPYIENLEEKMVEMEIDNSNSEDIICKRFKDFGKQQKNK